MPSRPALPSATGIHRRSMATSLCSALALVTLLQAPPTTDSLATLRDRAVRDSTDAQMWLLLGRAHLGLRAGTGVAQCPGVRGPRGWWVSRVRACCAPVPPGASC